MAEQQSAWDGFLGGASDTFASLAKAYIGMETVKAQAGALKTQYEYNALTGYNPSYLSNPNVYPLSAEQLAAAQRGAVGGGLLGGSTGLLLIGGFVLIGAILLARS